MLHASQHSPGRCGCRRTTVVKCCFPQSKMATNALHLILAAGTLALLTAAHECVGMVLPCPLCSLSSLSSLSSLCPLCPMQVSHVSPCVSCVSCAPCVPLLPCISVSHIPGSGRNDVLLCLCPCLATTHAPTLRSWHCSPRDWHRHRLLPAHPHAGTTLPVTLSGTTSGPRAPTCWYVCHVIPALHGHVTVVASSPGSPDPSTQSLSPILTPIPCPGTPWGALTPLPRPCPLPLPHVPDPGNRVPAGHRACLS